MSLSVVRRTSEIGIRIALGAQARGVLWMVLRESMILLAGGLAVGIPAAMAAGRLLESQLYQVSAFDPVALAGAVLIIAAVTLSASWLPAHRATKVDPMVALRCE